MKRSDLRHLNWNGGSSHFTNARDGTQNCVGSGTAWVILEIMGASDLAGGLPRRLVISVKAIAVFAILYYLSNSLSLTRIQLSSNDWSHSAQ
jgi:hypothetical protein